MTQRFHGVIEFCIKRRDTLNIIIALLLAFTSIFYVLWNNFSRLKHLGFFLNPDFTAYTYMAHNIVYEHGSIFLWHFGNALYLFPDITVLVILTNLMTNAQTVLLTYIALQMLYFFFMIAAVFKSTTHTVSGFRIGILSILALLNIMVSVQPFQLYYRYDYLSTLFTPAMHFSVMLIHLTTVYLLVKIIEYSSLYLKMVLLIVLLLSGLSDSLTVVYVTLPCVFTMTLMAFMKRIPKKMYFELMTILFISFIGSWFLSHIISFEKGSIPLHISFSYITLLEYVRTMLVFFQKTRLLGTLWILFIVIAPILLYQNRANSSKLSSSIFFVITFEWLTVIVSTPIILLVVQQVLPADFASTSMSPFHKIPTIPYRYFICYFLGPIILGVPLLLYQCTPLKKTFNNRKYYVRAIVFFALLPLLHPHALKFHNENILTYQDPAMRCFNIDAKQYHLTNGISDDYYVSNTWTTLNTQHAHIALTRPDGLGPLAWLNTSAVFRYHHYNFAISAKTDLPHALFMQYGKPFVTLTCKGYFNEYFIYVYQNDALSTVFDKNPI